MVVLIANLNQNKAEVLHFSKLSNFITRIFSIDTKGPRNPASEADYYFYVLVGHFSNKIVTIPLPKIMLIAI